MSDGVFPVVRVGYGVSGEAIRYEIDHWDTGGVSYVWAVVSRLRLPDLLPAEGDGELPRHLDAVEILMDWEERFEREVVTGEQTSGIGEGYAAAELNDFAAVVFLPIRR